MRLLLAIAATLSLAGLCDSIYGAWQRKFLASSVLPLPM